LNYGNARLRGGDSRRNYAPTGNGRRFVFNTRKEKIYMWYQSRKLWLFVSGSVFAFLALLVSIQWPQYTDLAKAILIPLESIVIALIVSVTVDDTVKAIVAYKLRYLEFTYGSKPGQAATPKVK